MALDLKDAKPVVDLGVLGTSEFREVAKTRAGDDLVPVPCGFVHVHVMVAGTGRPFTVLVAESVFEEHVLPHIVKACGAPRLSVVPPPEAG